MEDETQKYLQIWLSDFASVVARLESGEPLSESLVDVALSHEPSETPMKRAKRVGRIYRAYDFVVRNFQAFANVQAVKLDNQNITIETKLLLVLGIFYVSDIFEEKDPDLGLVLDAWLKE